MRTVDQLREVINVIEPYGVKRSKRGLKIYMMCKILSNILLAEKFLKYVDSFSIGHNDLAQLTFGLDRDSHIVTDMFDERNEVVKIPLQ